MARNSKKGFTLIELMVVVAIIGVLALLGLRLYTGQQQKAKDAIVKANAGTVQTLLQAELADLDMWATSAAAIAVITEATPANAGMQNPYGNAVILSATADGDNYDIAADAKVAVGNEGAVLVGKDTLAGSVHLVVQGIGGDGTLTGSTLSVYK